MVSRAISLQERIKWSQTLWKWIATHANELGIGRPYLDKDPPHVRPVDGREYVQKRSRAKARLAAKNAAEPLVEDMTKRATAAKLAKARS